MMSILKSIRGPARIKLALRDFEAILEVELLALRLAN